MEAVPNKDLVSTGVTRPLKKAHTAETRPSDGCPAPSGTRLRRYLEYAWTHLRWVPRPGYPSVRMGDAALHLAFLSCLGEKGFRAAGYTRAAV